MNSRLEEHHAEEHRVGEYRAEEYRAEEFRAEEFRKLRADLEAAAPDLGEAVSRAEKRLRRERTFRPLAGVASACAAFVLLVNFCSPVARACAQIPLLRELAAAVTFSPSLSRAVAEEYVQPLDLTQSRDGLTVGVSHLIADDSQIVVFVRAETESGETPRFRAIIPGPAENFWSGIWQGGADYGEQGGDPALLPICIDIREEADVPETFSLVLEQLDGEGEGARFSFEIPVDRSRIAPAREYPIMETVELDGQRILLEKIRVYPTRLRLDVRGEEENTAWLRGLDFTVAADGRNFAPPAEGVTAEGSLDEGDFRSFYAESSYFYGAERLTLSITGAKWLDKDRAETVVYPDRGEAENLPDGVHYVGSANDGKILLFDVEQQEPDTVSGVFGFTYRDAAGEERQLIRAYPVGRDVAPGCFRLELSLEEDPGEFVVLRPHISRRWEAEEAVRVKISLQ